jgi:hypothetical protein
MQELQETLQDWTTDEASWHHPDCTAEKSLFCNPMSIVVACRHCGHIYGDQITPCHPQFRDILLHAETFLVPRTRTMDVTSAYYILCHMCQEPDD